MENLKENNAVKIVQVAYAAGCNMPRHVATCDAYLIAEEGNALLIYADERREVNKGSFAMIPANEEHLLKVIDDFKGFIVLQQDGIIRFADEKLQAKEDEKRPD
jgi:quercetin dioxygenase-like cupin family protein